MILYRESIELQWSGLDLRNIKNRTSNNQCGFIYLLLKKVYWAKFGAKLFSDEKRLGLPLQSSQLKFSRPTRIFMVSLMCNKAVCQLSYDNL